MWYCAPFWHIKFWGIAYLRAAERADVFVWASMTAPNGWNPPAKPDLHIGLATLRRIWPTGGQYCPGGTVHHFGVLHSGG